MAFLLDSLLINTCLSFKLARMHILLCSGDLYELAWKGGGITISSCSRRPEVMHVPPSEDKMATWLHPIITCGGQDRAGDNDIAGQRSDNRVITSEDLNKLLKENSGKTVENNMATDTASDSSVRRKATGGTHSQTEKRRRSKINKCLKTLRRLVPGCEKRCSQASTLDLTIKYIKSLQRQVQAMSVAVGSSMTQPAGVAAVVPPVPVAAAAPGVIQVQPGLVLCAPPPMIPLAPMVPTVMMPAPLVCRATPSVAGHGGCRHGAGSNRRVTNNSQLAGLNRAQHVGSTGHINQAARLG
ncbi:uncharacterized protein [Aegilops tauschii subsp. strangulata]|uniref:uncharacterized protein n=1 Tax=Aegilops tauschii subsp. strangulata TaxID=200361 RepID=UPI001E1C9DF2|nr:transcription factor BHLH094-like [Aegilops tauschii subsp. strangulata]